MIEVSQLVEIQSLELAVDTESMREVLENGLRGEMVLLGFD